MRTMAFVGLYVLIILVNFKSGYGDEWSWNYDANKHGSLNNLKDGNGFENSDLSFSSSTNNSNLTGGAVCSKNNQCLSNYCVRPEVLAESTPNSKAVAMNVKNTNDGRKQATYTVKSQSKSYTIVYTYDETNSPLPTLSSNDLNNILEQIGMLGAGLGYCAMESSLVSGKVGEGGRCANNAQCASGLCANFGIAHFCSRESVEENKVAGGGICHKDENCFSNVCMPILDLVSREESTMKMCSVDAPEPGLVGSSGRCRKDTECYSNYCVKVPGSLWNGICSTASPEPGLVGGGGPCRENKNCFSQRCIKPRLAPNERAYGPQINVCAVDSSKFSIVGEGGPCLKDNECFARFCVKVNATESTTTPASLPQSLPGVTVLAPAVKTTSGYCAKQSIVEGRIGQGGYCEHDYKCYSGICIAWNGMQFCAKESPVRKLVGGGGPCFRDGHCYSGLCTNRLAIYHNVTATSRISKARLARVCARDGQKKLTIGGGGDCSKDNQCFSKKCYKLYPPGSAKSQGICAKEAQKQVTDETESIDDAVDDKKVTVKKPTFLRLVEDGGPCEEDKECASKRCWNNGKLSYCTKRSVMNHKGIGEGGACSQNADCASGVCASLSWLRKSSTSAANGKGDQLFCAKESALAGLVGSGGPCHKGTDCYSGHCVQLRSSSGIAPGSASDNSYTVALGFCARSSDVPGLVGRGGPCLSHADCKSKRCGRLRLLDVEAATPILRSMHGRQICVAQPTAIRAS